MKGRTILVTGGSRGLGRQIVERLAAENTVIAISRSGEGVTADSVVNLPCDLTDPAGLAACVDEACRRWPEINVLINNAAVLASRPIVMMSDADIMHQVETNLLAPMLLTKRVLRTMMRRRWGRIVNIVSMSAKLCKPGDSVYAATKAGLEVFGKIVNVEAHSYGVTVNNLAISASPSGMLEQIVHDNSDKIRTLIPHGRLADLDGIMAGIEFFCAEGSADIGGQTVFLGGV
ncbi:MAG: SDR family oxidoreductase [Phaeospirillum sp.]|nr:SDR family oxidoreductase [Phaeospirillum sp.]